MINILKSKLRAKLLSYYFSRPDVDLYLRELARELGEDPANLLRELAKLEKEGIFISLRRGKQRYFKLNNNYPFYKELKSVVSKTIGIEGSLGNILKKIKGVKLCFIYGSYASGKERPGSDVDLFIVGSADIDLLLEKINKLEKEIGREINYRLFSETDFKKAIKEKNSFIINILKNKKIFLIGNEKDIGKFN